MQQTQYLSQVIGQLLRIWTGRPQLTQQVSEILLQGKYPQKFVFYFIRILTTNQDVSFNELNLRKCLSVKVVQENGGSVSFLQSIQSCPSQDTNEAFLSLLRFALDSEGGPSLWLDSLVHAIESLTSIKLMLQIAKAFVEQIEFKNGDYHSVNSPLKISQLVQSSSKLVMRNIAVYVLQRDCKLLELR